MKTCHSCNAELTDEELQAGHCGACEPQSVATYMRTVDSLALPSERDSDSFDFDSLPAVGDDKRSDQTIAAVDSAATIGSDSIDSTSLPTAGVKPATVSDIRGMQTIDSDAGSVDVPRDGTVDERKYQVTVVSADIGGNDPGTPTDRQVAKVDNSSVVADDPHAMNDMWAGEQNAGTTPRMTIKGREEPLRSSNQSLVVQRRAFREVSAEPAFGGDADYELVKKLGEGGMGVVYAGRQASIDRTVAIKMLKPQVAADQGQRNKFLAEAVITGDLDHPNIVPIYDLGANDEGALFYAMKCVKGTPWDDCIHKATVQDFQAAIRGYLEHSESISMSVRATNDLQAAQITDRYEDYSRAVFGFEEAYALWDGDKRALGAGELKLMGGHSGYVNSAVFSPKGEFVLTASDDRTAKLWAAVQGTVVRSFEGHAGRVRDAAFSADGSLVLTASADTTARIWKTDTAELVRELKGHKWAVLSAAFSADGLSIITGSDDHSARVWDTLSGDMVRTLAGHTAPVTSVAFSPDGKRALTASDDFTAKLWDTETGKEILNLRGHSQEVTSATFSDDGRFALTGSRDGTAILWLTEQWLQPVQGE